MSTKSKQPQGVPTLKRDWAYYGGDGEAVLEQEGSKLRLLLTWRPNRSHPSPHYILEAKLVHTSPAGRWSFSGEWFDTSDVDKRYHLRGHYDPGKDEIRLDGTEDVRSEFLDQLLLTPRTDADPEQEAALTKGAAFWNKWRSVQKIHAPRLARTNFEGRSLEGANLAQADLSASVWKRCRLANASFRRANLVGIDLRGTDLSGVDFTDATLRGADLRAACLRNATLIGANLSGAAIEGADFDAARLRKTAFCDVETSKAENLERCWFVGKSYADIKTLASGQATPRRFLEGCGVSQEFTDRLPLLVDSGSPTHSCFISFASEDVDIAAQLERELRADGIRVYFFPENIRVGDKVERKIFEAIDSHDRFIVLLSENSVASDWVKREVELGLRIEQKRRGDFLIPVQLGDDWSKSRKAWVKQVKQRDLIDYRDRSQNAYRLAYDRLFRLLCRQE